jgi:hypothetical protein
VGALAARRATAGIINVPDDYPTIQEAIEAAEQSDEIIVAADEYFETIDLLGKAITVRSTDPEDPEVVAGTIINAQGLGTVVTCCRGEGPETVLSGFTITGGSAVMGGGMLNNAASPTVRNCVFTGNVSDEEGGGMCNLDCDVAVMNCILEDNFSGDNGGGMYNDGGHPTIAGCTFAHNSHDDHEDGAGMYNSAQAAIVGCTFDSNDGTGLYNSTGGNLDVIGCTFIANTRSGLYNSGLWSGSSATVLDCVFLGNGKRGMGNYDMVLTLVDSVFSGNVEPDGYGGALRSYGFDCEPELNIIGCTFAGNLASMGRTLGCHGYYNGYSTEAWFTNCIIWNGGDEFWSGNGSIFHVNYTCINGGHPDEGNIEDDPAFIDADGADGILGTEDDNLRLQPWSPCIDGGNNTAVPPDAFDLDGDGDTEEPLPLDLDGNPRFVDDPDTEDTGYGEPPIVDMGAYEYQADACPADFDGDGVVNTADLLYLLAAWGTPDGDVDGDGDTDTADLLALLGAWGECPGPPCPWDFSGDGVVDDLDLAIMIEHFGDCPDPPAECPWDLTGDGVVDVYDQMELYLYYGPCP